MSLLLNLFRQDFLLHNAFWGSMAVGVFCPLIGVYFILRRMTLLGVALPQISAAGIALAFYLQGLGLHWSMHAGEPDDKFMALTGSLALTLLAIFVFAAFEKRGSQTSESRIGVGFAMAYAAAILLVSGNPTGNIEMLNMLQGEIVAVNSRDLHWLLGVFGALTVGLALFGRQFLLVSFDRETAQVLGKNVWVWDTLLYCFVGIALAVSVLIVGPMLTFAFLIIPPLAARRFCRRMPAFFGLSSLIGASSALFGFYISYRWDWPLGPSAILMASAFLFASFLVKKVSS